MIKPRKLNIHFTIILVLICVFCINEAIAQEAKKEAQSVETKMDKFGSKTGTITKFIDNKLPDLKTSYASVVTRIRRVYAGDQIVYFYQIENSNSTASIEYSDLLEVVKAFNALKSEVEKDVESNPDYLENKFVTADGFQIGYFVDKGKATWYLKLEKYGTENTLFIKDERTIEEALNGAKSKIEELKGK